MAIPPSNLPDWSQLYKLLPDDAIDHIYEMGDLETLRLLNRDSLRRVGLIATSCLKQLSAEAMNTSLPEEVKGILATANQSSEDSWIQIKALYRSLRNAGYPIDRALILHANAAEIIKALNDLVLSDLRIFAREVWRECDVTPHCQTIEEYHAWFEENQEVLAEIRLLDLSNKNLTSLPSLIRYLTGLEELKLTGNKLRHLPVEICKLADLRVLDLANNRLRKLPREIQELTFLNILNLSNNEFDHFPEEVLALTCLNALRLSNNHIESLPASIQRLQRVSCLVLDGNRLSLLPGEIGNLTSLQILILSKNRLQNLPRTMGQLARLQVLCLDDNELKTLPDELGNLPALRLLNVYWNYLGRLPAGLSHEVKLLTSPQKNP